MGVGGALRKLHRNNILDVANEGRQLCAVGIDNYSGIIDTLSYKTLLKHFVDGKYLYLLKIYCHVDIS